MQMSVCLGTDSNSKNSRTYKGKSLLSLEDSYVSIDLETTGFDPSFDNIIEIGATKVENGTTTSKFQSLINPGYEIDDFISKLTGITNEALKNAPYLEDILPSFLDFVGNNIVVGHNVNFDINFLYDNCNKLSLNPFSNDFVDTLRLSRRIFKEFSDHKLTTLVKEFGISETVEHRALSDCIKTSQCYEYIKSYVLENDVTDKLKVNKSYNVHPKIHSKDINPTTEEFQQDSPLYNKTCVFTGTLEKMIRKEAMQIVVNLGGHCADNVTQKVDYLILGNNDYCKSIKDGKSNKQKKAESMKLKGSSIEIISENVFYDMLEELK